MINRKLIVLSSYSTMGCGISSYTNNLIESLTTKNIEIYNLRVNFFKNIIYYFFSFPLIFFKVFSLILLNDKKKSILIQYTPTTSGPLIPFILMMRLFNKTKVILEIHEITDVYKNRFFYNVFVFLEYILIKFSNQIVVHNETHSKYILKKYNANKNIKIIEHPIGLISKVEKKVFARKNFLILGQIRKSKNYELIIKSFEQYKKINKDSEHKLIIAGESTDNNYLKKIKNIIKFSSISNEIVLTGFINEKEIDTIMRSSYLIILLYSKITQSGPFSLSIAYGLPSITSDAEYFQNFMDKYRVGLVSKISEKSLLNCFNLITSDKNLYLKMIDESKRAFKDMNWENASKKYIDILF